jgi:hypothetical protein
MSRERIFNLADQIIRAFATDEVGLKAPEDVRVEVVRTLSDESRLEESIDTEVRRILATYSHRSPEGSHEWEIMYQKTREDVRRRRFRE